MTLALLNIGPLEWMVLLGGAVLLFGGDLPGVIRKLAVMLGKLRATAADLGKEMDLHGRNPTAPPHPPALPPALPLDQPNAESERDASLGSREPAAQTGEEAKPGPAGESQDTESPPLDHSDWESEIGPDQSGRIDEDRAEGT